MPRRPQGDEAAAWLQRIGARAAAWHFCLHHSPSQSEPVAMVRSIAAQLRERLPGFDEALRADPAALKKAMMMGASGRRTAWAACAVRDSEALTAVAAALSARCGQAGTATLPTMQANTMAKYTPLRRAPCFVV